jgi:glycosyltransferase involved in cell wall biosynthesis
MADAPSPRVSVVTATYNGARVLPAAIESILAQSYTDFEYVIVDDASTDATPARSLPVSPRRTPASVR